MICPMCKEQSQGPGCCGASLRAELWRLEGQKEGLRDAFNRRQTPYLQGQLLKVTEDIAGVKAMLSQYAPQEPPRLSGGVRA